MKELSEAEIRELAGQLRSPQGEQGIDVGQKMHETNINMTMAGVDALKLVKGDILLEIGHGNASHVKQTLNRDHGLHYAGLDISETMHEEARRINSALIDRGHASFHLYGGETFPFPDNLFHKIMTVNTIYFWDRPSAILEEAHRVLKPEGLLSIVFAQKSFMEELPFVEYGFRLYDNNDIERLVEQTLFEIIHTQTVTEQVESKDGSQVERTFTTITLKG
ncbi:Methyltransferase domain-containing protein [Fodinibius roseus]|uniref:Methyltransferase domain-containing protein n=1 Tax=Fodinibius roseus TaxID=1194090 RepID=A0A1M5GD29_9BACT|nr:class I SAM-dependent methyltransferase [Fodinibius roseus]SHG01596.1 Methyltransferase domain-containing protein [Fodinibius roseus]